LVMNKVWLSAESEHAKELEHFVISVLGLLFGENNVRDWKRKLLIIFVLEIIFGITATFDLLTGGGLTQFGIQPRRLSSLLFLTVAPFIQPTFGKFLFNVLPFAVLSAFVLMRARGITIFIVLCSLNIFIGGSLVWIFGRPDIIFVGASGFVFAYFGYLLFYGPLVKEFRATVISILVFICYGGIFWALFPVDDATNMYEMNLAGFFVGVALGIVDAKTEWINKDQFDEIDDGKDGERDRLTAHDDRDAAQVVDNDNILDQDV